LIFPQEFWKATPSFDHLRNKQNPYCLTILPPISLFPALSPFGGAKNLSPATIATGARIDSYFVHFDSVGEPQNPVVVFGTITFDRDVLGIMVLQETST